jgi:hypothetical protein
VLGIKAEVGTVFVFGVGECRVVVLKDVGGE